MRKRKEVDNATKAEFESIETAQSSAPTYWLTRFVILRFLGLIYAIAFLVVLPKQLFIG